MRIEVEQEEDGRWLAEVPELPGVLAYGPSREVAVGHAQALALRVLADRLDVDHAAKLSAINGLPGIQEQLLQNACGTVDPGNVDRSSRYFFIGGQG